MAGEREREVSASGSSRRRALVEGAGLPASALRRVQAMASSGTWTSQLSVPELHALRGVGFEPVGQVLGGSVFSLGWTGRGACGGASTTRSAPGTVGRERTATMRPLTGSTDTLTQVRRSALRRLQAEAAALGADGVVGVHLSVRPVEGSSQRALEHVAVGTAVRAGGPAHLVGPFLSDLSGQDTALLLRAGWVPTGLVMGVGAVVAHDGWRVGRRRRAFSGNVEVEVYSDLATQSRRDARARLDEDVRLHTGTTVVLSSTTDDVYAQRCATRSAAGDVDHVAQTVMFGTALAPLHRDAAPAPHAVLDLSGGPGPARRSDHVDPRAFRSRS